MLTINSFAALIVTSFFSVSSSLSLFSSSNISSILDQCYGYLNQNLCVGEKWGKKYHFNRPSQEKYSPDQWLWDSGAHMIVWSNRNVNNSILDIRTMLQFQQDNGRIPEEIFWGDKTEKENAKILLQYSNTQFTDITQMPVLPYSLRSIAEKLPKSEAKSIVEEFLYPLVDYFDWWRNERDLGDGLVTIIHNWESGLDASPAYDPAFHEYVTVLNESAFLKLYSDFEEVMETYRLVYKWNIPDIMARAETASTMQDRKVNIDSKFFVKDVAVNSVYASGWYVLSKLASSYLNDEELAERCLKEYKITFDAIMKKMFIGEFGGFRTLYIDSDAVEKVAPANTIQNLFPLLLTDLPDSMVEIILHEIENPDKFYSKYALPTVAMVSHHNIVYYISPFVLFIVDY